jgi:hypothetical protein
MSGLGEISRIYLNAVRQTFWWPSGRFPQPTLVTPVTANFLLPMPTWLMLKLSLLEWHLQLRHQLRVARRLKPKVRLLHLHPLGRSFEPARTIQESAALMQWRLHLEAQANPLAGEANSSSKSRQA